MYGKTTVGTRFLVKYPADSDDGSTCATQCYFFDVPYYQATGSPYCSPPAREYASPSAVTDA